MKCETEKYASKKMSKCRIWTGNALKMGKMTHKKRSLWRSTILDHLPPCGFDVKDNKYSLFYAPPPFCKSWIHHCPGGVG